MPSRKKPTGEALVKWCKDWDVAGHAEKLELATLYNTTYDVAKHWRSESTNVVPIPEPVIIIPQSVTPLQARKILRAYGLYDTVSAWIASEACTDAQRDEWEYAIEIRRDNETLALAAVSLGLTAEQLDQMFIDAAKL